MRSSYFRTFCLKSKVERDLSTNQSYFQDRLPYDFDDDDEAVVDAGCGCASWLTVCDYGAHQVDSIFVFDSELKKLSSVGLPRRERGRPSVLPGRMLFEVLLEVPWDHVVQSVGRFLEKCSGFGYQTNFSVVSQLRSWPALRAVSTGIGIL